MLFILANIAFGASVVVYNSFLPQLAPPDKRDSVSSIGWAIGYIGGGLLLPAQSRPDHPAGRQRRTAEIARWSIVSAGVWWAVFTSLPLARLHNRPAVAGEEQGNVIIDGFRQLGDTLRHLFRYKLTFYFLIAYLIYNDGIQTVITMASVYADKYLGLEQSVQIQTILLVQFLAFGGALLLGRLAKRYGAWKTVLGSLVLWTVVVGIAYFLPKHSQVGEQGQPLLHGPGSAARHRARRQPGIEPVAVQPADPARQGGRVLRPLRDLRQGDQLARARLCSASSSRPPAPTGTPSSRWSCSSPSASWRCCSSRCAGRSSTPATRRRW